MTHIFLTGTLRCANTDFLFWLFRPGIVKISCRNAVLLQHHQVEEEEGRQRCLSLFQQPDSAWDLLRGVPSDPNSAVPWHCVCCEEADVHAGAASPIIGDVVTIDDECEAKKILVDLNKFFGIGNGDGEKSGAHRQVCVNVRAAASERGRRYDNCICFIACDSLRAHIVEKKWTRIPSNDYVSSSTCPALPMHRQMKKKNNDSGGPASPTRPPQLIIVIVDGAGDSHTPGGAESRTPLERATASDGEGGAGGGLSIITRHGVSGMMDPFEPGVACGSDTAHLNLFGFPPSLWYRGRGAFESLGAGMSMVPGQDVAFKSNFSTIDDETGIVLRRRCDRNFTAEGPVLCAALDALEPVVVDGQRYRARVKYATEHRCGVVISGPGLSDRISGTDPLVDNKPLVRCAPFLSSSKKKQQEGKIKTNAEEEAAAAAAAVRTCQVIEAMSDSFRAALRHHPINKERIVQGKPPANVVLLRGAAQTAPNPAFEAVQGLRSMVIAPTCIISGFARSVGMTVFDAAPHGATGDVHSNLMGKAQVAAQVMFSSSAAAAAAAAVDGKAEQQQQQQQQQKQSDDDDDDDDDDDGDDERFDLGVVHVKGCDDAGHDGHPDVKADVLARAGKMLERIWGAAPSGTVFCIFADHSTPCAHLDHGPDAVPVSVGIKPASDGGAARRRAKVMADGVEKYTELDCQNGGALGRFCGGDLMKIIRNVTLSQLF